MSLKWKKIKLKIANENILTLMMLLFSLFSFFFSSFFNIHILTSTTRCKQRNYTKYVYSWTSTKQNSKYVSHLKIAFILRLQMFRNVLLPFPWAVCHSQFLLIRLCDAAYDYHIGHLFYWFEKCLYLGSLYILKYL